MTGSILIVYRYIPMTLKRPKIRSMKIDNLANIRPNTMIPVAGHYESRREGCEVNNGNEPIRAS